VEEDRTGRNLDRALTVAQAAEVLGVSQDAVRKRIRRGTIQSGRDESGKVYVYVPASETVHKTGQDTSQPQSDTTALISAKDETIAALRDQLEAERQAHAESRRLLMAALERIPPQLEAPSSASEARESPETARDTPEGAAEPHPGTEEPQEDVPRPQERSWWRRMFGG
jgi:excisionase family DNA binding protein